MKNEEIPKLKMNRIIGIAYFQAGRVLEATVPLKDALKAVVKGRGGGGLWIKWAGLQAKGARGVRRRGKTFAKNGQIFSFSV